MSVRREYCNGTIITRRKERRVRRKREGQEDSWWGMSSGGRREGGREEGPHLLATTKENKQVYHTATPIQCHTSSGPQASPAFSLGRANLNQERRDREMEEGTAATSGNEPIQQGQEFDWTALYEGKEHLFEKRIYLSSTVVHGFKRGSKELGIPTANLGMDELGTIGETLETGIYFGWARLKGTFYQTVVSIGWNPFYHNTVKTIEAHLLSSLDDFYDEQLELLLIGYLRQEANFKSLGESSSRPIP
jgi:riboflavin kinase